MSEVSLGYRRVDSGPLSRWLTFTLRLNYETTAYLALIGIAAGFRFWDLGSRALHHDESLHAYYSWNLYQNGVYEHLPLMHGPFQFFGTAFIYLLFGASEYTARILPAIFGTALVGLPYFLRGRLGRIGALSVSFFIAFSPTLLYYSRFARNDIYIAFFTLGLVICVWRYIEKQKPAYLYLSAFLLALSFATKENTFINIAVLLVFLDLWLAFDFWRQVRDSNGLTGFASFSVLAVFALFGWAIVALWPITRSFRESLGLSERHPAADLMLVLGTLTLPQLAAGVQVPLERLGFGDADMNKVVSNDFLWFGQVDREQIIAVSALALMTMAAGAVGMAWNWRLWLLAAAAFYVPYVLLYTSFFTNGDGFYSGNWGSLDYWVSQQDVRRGNQPDFYYLVLLPVYELLPLLFAGPALLYYCLRGGVRAWLLTLLAAAVLLLFFAGDSIDPALSEGNMALLIPVAALALFAAVQGDMFERFLVFWYAATIFGYSAAGEKMPWLSVHTSLPIILLSGYTLNKLLSREMTERLPHFRAAVARPFLALLTGGAAGAFAAYGPAGDIWVAARILGLFAAISVVIMLAGSRIAAARNLAAAGPLLAALLAGPLLVISFHSAISAAYENGDVPREMLIYTQTSPAVPDVMQRIEQEAARSGLGHSVPVVVDSAYSWPWYWYLRNYTNVQHLSIDANYQPPAGAILLLASNHAGLMKPYLAAYDVPLLFPLRWWFPEGDNIGGPGYRDIQRDNIFTAFKDFGADLADGGTWQTWWRYLAHHTPPGPQPEYQGERARCPQCGSADSIAYFPLDYTTVGN